MQEQTENDHVKGYIDYTEMIDAKELDFIIICTPSGLRLGLVQKAAARGIVCFIEKPPANNLTEAFEIE